MLFEPLVLELALVFQSARDVPSWMTDIRDETFGSIPTAELNINLPTLRPLGRAFYIIIVHFKR